MKKLNLLPDGVCHENQPVSKEGKEDKKGDEVEEEEAGEGEELTFSPLACNIQLKVLNLMS